MIRDAAVAGSFYPHNEEELNHLLDQFISGDKDRHTVHGIIVPHAGYIYSGSVAGDVFARVEIPSRVILLGPNHHGAGPDISVSGAEAWTVPGGDVPVNQLLVDQVIQACANVVVDNQAHQFEHSLEVMLPFLTKINPAVEIVPLSLRGLSFAQCCALGEQLASVINGNKEEILLLASTDMNHFLAADDNEKLDRLAIDAMTAYDPQTLYETVISQRIGMCGFHAVVAVMVAVRLLGSASCKLINYAHSGMVNGDNRRVVGYAGLILE